MQFKRNSISLNDLKWPEASSVLHTVQINFHAMDENKSRYIQTPIGLLIFLGYRSCLQCTMWSTVITVLHTSGWTILKYDPNIPCQGAHLSGKFDFSSRSGNSVKWSGKLENFQTSGKSQGILKCFVNPSKIEQTDMK